MLTDEEYETFFQLLDHIVNRSEGGTWKDRRGALLSKADEADMTNLLEFLSWDLEAHMPPQ